MPAPARGVALSGVLVAAAALLSGCGGPVEITPPPPSERSACDTLARQLPQRLADLPRAEVTPTDADGAAWGDPPMTLTCGVGTAVSPR